VLKDSEEYASAELTVTQKVLFLISKMDGANSIAQLKSIYKETYGVDLPEGQMENLIEVLNKHYMFDNARFERRKAEVEAAWDKALVRPSISLAMVEQSADRESALNHLASLMDNNYAKAALSAPAQILHKSNGLAAIMAPHIDYIRGGAAYGHAYGEVASQFGGDIVVVLGTNHQSSDRLLTATKKDFATPFGAVSNAQELVQELADCYPSDIFAGERDHRIEHSIELAVASLKHALADRNFSVVPLLISNVDTYIMNGADPALDPALEALVACLRNWQERFGARLLLSASVDLCHVGKQFGDPFLVDEDVQNSMKQADERLLKAIASRSDAIFWRLIEGERNERRICGAGTLIVLLRAVRSSYAKILFQDLWVDESLSGAVGFGSVAFYH